MENTEQERKATEALGYIAGICVGAIHAVMNRKVLALVSMNVGVFIAAAAMLPRASSYFYSGPISHFINARLHWEIPWLVTLGSTCITVGAVLLFSGRKEH